MKTLVFAAVALMVVYLPARGSADGHRGATGQSGSVGASSPRGAAANRKLNTRSSVSAVSLQSPVALATDDLEWVDAPPVLPPGARIAILEGNPRVANQLFTIRLRIPANYRIAPHYHPADERLTVISGTFQLAHGERFDRTALKSYPAGSYVAIPAGMAHFAATSTETIIQLTGIGPWDIVYLDPRDDPRLGTGGAGARQQTPERRREENRER